MGSESSAKGTVHDPGALAEARAIMSSLDHGLHSAYMAGDAQAVEQVRALYERAFTKATPTGGAPHPDSPPKAAPETGGPDAAAPEESALAQTDDAIPPPPHPALAPAWRDPETRAVVTALRDGGMMVSEQLAWIEYAGKTDPATIPQPKETLMLLREQWGSEFDAKLAAARSVVQRMPSAFTRFLNETALGDDPRVIKRLAEMGEALR